MITKNLYAALLSVLLTVMQLCSSSTAAFAFVKTIGGSRANSRDCGVLLPLRFSVDDVESNALAAAEAWDTHVTSFLNGKEADMVEKRLENRADVACFRVGGRSSSRRARFVLTNPELGLDLATAEAEYCAVLFIANAKTNSNDSWPNVLSRIGVDLKDVGDIVVVEGEGCYMAVSPKVSKQCMRLLPKEIAGTGVLVSLLEADDATIPDDGETQDMDIQRLDKRQQKRK